MPQHWPEMVYPAGSLQWHCSCAGNGIGDEGMKAFSEALKSNSSLTSVDLQSMPVRHHMNVRCMRLRLCCVALGPGRCCCHGALVQSVLIRFRPLHVTGLGVFVEYLLHRPPSYAWPLRFVGAEDFGLGDVPQRCWCPRARPCAGAARTMCQASARRRATHALPEHVFLCVVPAPPPPLRCGRGGGRFRTEGMRPAKEPDAYPPPPPQRDGRAVSL